MAERQVRITLRDKQTAGGSIPGTALLGEPFINLYDGVLKFSGVTGGGFETSNQTDVFEVGSALYNQKITNRLSVNGNFVVSGDTGLISTYNSTSGSGLVGKFLSGTTNGFVLGDITSIQGVPTQVQPGRNIATGGTALSPIINLIDSPSVNNINYSGTSIGGSSIANSVSATTSIYSAGTSLETIIYNIAASTENITSVQPGTNITTGGTASSPIINVVDSPSFLGLVSATGFTDSSLTSTRVVYVGAGGRLVDEAGFEYDEATDTLSAGHAIFGIAGQTGTTLTVHGDFLVMGDAISGFTSQLYIEDNFIELNYNPTADTSSTSLGAGWSIQDGSGVAGTDVFFDIRGTGTTISNRGFATNLYDIFIRESGTVSSPNGVRVLAEQDILDGGQY